jgi:hypothetical protein
VVPGLPQRAVRHCWGRHHPRQGEETVAGSADGDRAEKHGGDAELDSIGSKELYFHGGHEQWSRRGSRKDHGMTMGNIAANARPKALEDAAALSMVAVVSDWATVNSADATKGEEQLTNNM